MVKDTHEVESGAECRYCETEMKTEINSMQADKQVIPNKKTVLQLRLNVDKIRDENEIKKKGRQVDSFEPGSYYEDNTVTCQAVKAEEDKSIGE